MTVLAPKWRNSHKPRIAPAGMDRGNRTALLKPPMQRIAPLTRKTATTSDYPIFDKMLHALREEKSVNEVVALGLTVVTMDRTFTWLSINVAAGSP
jgi:hypothetical protein